MAKEDRKFWVGLGITLATSLLAAGVAWGCIKTDVANIKRELAESKTEQGKSRDDLREEVKSISYRMAEISTDIRWIKDRLSRDRPTRPTNGADNGGVVTAQR